MDDEDTQGAMTDLRVIAGTAITEEDVIELYQREHAGEPIDGEIPAGTPIDIPQTRD